MGSAAFPNRKPNTKDNDVASQESAKENHDKNYCAPRHQAIGTDAGSPCQDQFQLSRKKSESDHAFWACQRIAFLINWQATHESIHLYLRFADVDRATDRLGG